MEDAGRTIAEVDCTWMFASSSWEEKSKKEDCKWFHPKRVMQYESDHKNGNNMMAHALSEISKILSLLMQEHNKAHTGEKALGSP